MAQHNIDYIADPVPEPSNRPRNRWEIKKHDIDKTLTSNCSFISLFNLASKRFDSVVVLQAARKL